MVLGGGALCSEGCIRVWGGIGMTLTKFIETCHWQGGGPRGILGHSRGVQGFGDQGLQGVLEQRIESH